MTQRLSQVLEIQGGLSGGFLNSLRQGDRRLGELGRSIQALNGRSRQLSRALDTAMDPAQATALRAELMQVNRELAEQTASYNDLNQSIVGQSAALKRAGLAFGAAAGLAAGLGQVIRGVISDIRDLRRHATLTGLEEGFLGEAALTTEQLFPGLSREEIADYFGQASREITLRQQQLADGLADHAFIADLNLAGLSNQERLIKVLEAAYRRDAASRAAFLDEVVGGTEGEFLESVFQRGRGEELLTALRGAGSGGLADSIRTVTELDDSLRGLNNGFEQLKLLLTAGVAPALTGFINVVNAILGPIAAFAAQNETLVQILGGGLLLAIGALTVAAGVFLVSVVAPFIAAGIAMTLAWLPVAAPILAVVAAVGALVWGLQKLGLIDVGPGDLVAGINDLGTAAGAAGQQAAGATANVQVTNNISGSGDPAAVADLVNRDIGDRVAGSLYSGPGRF